MSRKARDNPEFSRHNVSLYVGDMARMQELYPTFGASHAIRTLIRGHIAAVEKRLKEGKRTGPIDVMEIEI